MLFGLQVSSNDPGVRMLRHGDNKAINSMPFLSSGILSGVSITGPVGAEGSIYIILQDKTSTGDQWGTGRFNLTIPFKLRKCHHGFAEATPSVSNEFD